jgi:hypothetical protein
VRDVGADLAIAGLHPLLQLRQELVHHLGPAHRRGRQPTGVPASHPVGHGLVVTPGQLAGVSIALSQVERFEYLHDLLGMLHAVPPRGLDG